MKNSNIEESPRRNKENRIPPQKPKKLQSNSLSLMRKIELSQAGTARRLALHELDTNNSRLFPIENAFTSLTLGPGLFRQPSPDKQRINASSSYEDEICSGVNSILGFSPE